jgi:hypothetical protein
MLYPMISDHDGFTECGKLIPAGTTVGYLAHVIGGMVRVQLEDESIVVMHPNCFPTLR